MALSLAKKLGRFAIFILILRTILLLVSWALLLFFWTSRVSDSTFRLLIINNWLNNAVSLIAEVLKQVINLQIGVAVAMCAAIALERSCVALPEAASCLAMRSGDYSVWNSAFLFWKGVPHKRNVRGVKSRTLTLFTCILLVIACVAQLASILLIGDIGLSQVPGLTRLSSVPYGFTYQAKSNGVPINVGRREIITIGPQSHNSSTVTTSSSTIIRTSTSLPVSSASSEKAEATTGPQGWSVSPGGWAPPPSNDLDTTAPLVNRQPTWCLEPQAYTNFAEYHEEPPSYDSDGIDDTGKTLRAFLPYSSANTRNTLQNFTGHTTVLDSRVTCQTPNLNNISLMAMETGSSIMFNGTVAPLHNTPRLFNSTAFYDQGVINPNDAMLTSVPAPFSCVVPNLNLSIKAGFSYPALQNGETDYLLALCQLVDGGSATNSQVSGGLVSEFVGMPDPQMAPASSAKMNFSSETGVAYLLIQVQDLKDSYWGRAWGNETANSGNATAQVLHGQWADVRFQDEHNSVAISTTLCYAAFDSANLLITASTDNSTTNRTDPTSRSDPRSNTTIVDFGPVRSQLTLGPGKQPLTISQRGLFQLAPRSSWLANGSQENPPAVSYLRDQANLAGTLGVGNTGNITLALWQLATDVGDDLPWRKADPSHVYLFQQMLRTDLGGGGSPAHALQALITVISSMAFYAQLPQSTAASEAEQTWFVTANVPVQARGLTTMAVATLIHMIMIMIITTLFSRECKLSMLGAEWQSLLQGMRGNCAELGDLEALDAMRDSEVEKLLKEVGKSTFRVGIERSKVDGRVCLTAHDPATDDAHKMGSASDA